MKLKYYNEAMVIWQRDMKRYGKSFDIPRIDKLTEPRLWKHPTIPNMYYGGEDVQEWADRCHPVWQEYRNLRQESILPYLS